MLRLYVKYTKTKNIEEKEALYNILVDVCPSGSCRPKLVIKKQYITSYN